MIFEQEEFIAIAVKMKKEKCWTFQESSQFSSLCLLASIIHGLSYIHPSCKLYSLFPLPLCCIPNLAFFFFLMLVGGIGTVIAYTVHKARKALEI